MDVEILQYPVVWEKHEENFDLIEAEFRKHPPKAGSLIVLPEMFSTGFSLNLGKVGEDESGPSKAFLCRLAQEFRCTVLGSFPRLGHGGSKGFNRLLVLDPTGEVLLHYDKIHPFSFGQEGDFYKAGLHLRLFDFAGLRICPTICYDLRFPELYRRAVLAGGAEVLIVIANWPRSRREHWRTLLKARAIENQAVVIGVNRIGEDPHLTYEGDSLIFDAKGEIVLDTKDRPGRFSATIDKGDLQAWRDSFPALRDATDVFELDC